MDFIEDMWSKITSDIILFIHFLWMGFLAVGGFAFIRYPRIRVLHLVGLILALIMQLLSIKCPLTTLEEELINFSYGKSFFIYYVEKIVYPEIPQEVVTTFTFFFILLFVILFIKKPL